MGFDYSLYVVSISGNEFLSDRGRIVQILITHISPNTKQSHIEKLCSIVVPIFGFMYSPPVLSNGICRAEDVPIYFTEVQQTAIVSHSMLWLAVYKKVLDDGCPFEPLKLFKYAPIVIYNKAKGGVDKATELEGRVRCNFKSSYETKYVFRMLVACLVNAWRV